MEWISYVSPESHKLPVSHVSPASPDSPVSPVPLEHLKYRIYPIKSHLRIKFQYSLGGDDWGDWVWRRCSVRSFLWQKVLFNETFSLTNKSHIKRKKEKKLTHNFFLKMNHWCLKQILHSPSKNLYICFWCISLYLPKIWYQQGTRTNTLHYIKSFFNGIGGWDQV